MKRICIILLALALMLPNLALAEGDKPTVTVTGSATVSVPADYAVVSLAVETCEKAVADALTGNAQRISQVLAALEQAGIPAADIVTDRFYIYTQYDYSAYSEDGSALIRGYQVSNALSVTVRDLAQVGSVIDTAIGAGANACSGIAFYSNASAQANDDALLAAVAEARRKAALVAAACGKTLGDMLSLTEEGGYSAGVRYAKSAALDAGTQIMAEGLDFTASVSATFALE